MILKSAKSFNPINLRFRLFLIFHFSCTIVLHTYGQNYLLHKISGNSKVKVVVFIAVDCPISQKYIPALNALRGKYTQGDVKIYSFIPGKIKRKDLENFIREYDIRFPVSQDKKYQWTKALAAAATPEVFVFDHNNSLKYHGAIDNWFYELGGYRKTPTENYLTDSIERLLEGKDPKIESTKALGCFIQIPM